jgi:large subunit ribosomal protein L35
VIRDRFSPESAPAVVFSGPVCHNPGRSPPADKGCRGGGKRSISTLEFEQSRRAGRLPTALTGKESQMPKIKTKSGAKKRFKVTGTGKVLSAMAGKRHGMIKRSNKQIRDHRGTRVMFKTDGDNIKKYFLPNG